MHVDGYKMQKCAQLSAHEISMHSANRVEIDLHVHVVCVYEVSRILSNVNTLEKTFSI